MKVTHYKITILLLLLFPVLCQAQKDSARLISPKFISFSVGAGQPDYYYLNNSSSTYATVLGPAAIMYLQLPVDNKKLDFLAIRLAYNANNAILQDDHTLVPYYNLPENGNISNISLSLGPFLTVPIGNRFAFDFRAMVGLFYALNFNSAFDNARIGIGLLLSGDMRVALTKKVDVILTFDTMGDLTAGIAYQFGK